MLVDNVSLVGLLSDVTRRMQDVALLLHEYCWAFIISQLTLPVSDIHRRVLQLQSTVDAVLTDINWIIRGST